VVLDCAFRPATCTALLTGVTAGNQLAGDATTLYWTIDNYAGSVQGALWAGPTVTNIAQNAAYPSHVAIDSTYVYWTAGRTLLRAPKAGPFSAQTLWTLPLNFRWEVPGSSILGLGSGALATDGVYVYVVYTDQGDLQRVEMCTVDGSTCVDARVGGSTYLGPIAAAGGFLVWTDYSVLVARRMY
jgi:hypothetical protein